MNNCSQSMPTSTDILVDNVHRKRKDTKGHFQQGQEPMQLKDVLEKESHPHRNIHFNEPAGKKAH